MTNVELVDQKRLAFDLKHFTAGTYLLRGYKQQHTS